MKFLVIFLAILMIGAVSASTVTLTGTCYSGIISDKSNYIQFNLTNSGDGTATNLVITPIIEGARPNNTTISIPLVKPNTTYAEKVYMWNFTTVGSYVERFVVRYDQGTQQFTTVFPCLAYFFKGAQSQLTITALGKNTSGVYVNISNVAGYPISAVATVYAPASFSVAPQSRNITVDGFGTGKASFVVVPPQYSDAEFPIAVGISYINGGVHYATLAITTITFAGNPSSKLQLGNILLLLGLLATIVIIIILIIISIIINRRKKRRELQNKAAQT